MVNEDAALKARGIEPAEVAQRQLVDAIGDRLVGPRIKREEARDNVVALDGCAEHVPDDVGLGAAGDEVRRMQQNPRLGRLKLVRDLLEPSFVPKLPVGGSRQMRVFEWISISMNASNASPVEPSGDRSREYARPVLKRVFHFRV